MISWPVGCAFIVLHPPAQGCVQILFYFFRSAICTESNQNWEIGTSHSQAVNLILGHFFCSVFLYLFNLVFPFELFVGSLFVTFCSINHLLSIIRAQISDDAPLLSHVSDASIQSFWRLSYFCVSIFLCEERTLGARGQLSGADLLK